MTLSSSLLRLFCFLELRSDFSAIDRDERTKPATQATKYLPGFFSFPLYSFLGLFAIYVLLDLLPPILPTQLLPLRYPSYTHSTPHNVFTTSYNFTHHRRRRHFLSDHPRRLHSHPHIPPNVSQLSIIPKSILCGPIHRLILTRPHLAGAPRKPESSSSADPDAYVEQVSELVCVHGTEWRGGCGRVWRSAA